jgi:hypothetical protein
MKEGKGPARRWYLSFWMLENCLTQISASSYAKNFSICSITRVKNHQLYKKKKTTKKPTTMIIIDIAITTFAANTGNVHFTQISRMDSWARLCAYPSETN